MNKIHVTCHVSLEDSVQRAEKSLEALSVQVDALDVGFGEDVGGSGLVSKKSQLSKVITMLVFHNHFIPRSIESCIGLAVHEYVEGVTLLALLDHLLSGRKLLLFYCVGEF